MAVLRATDSTFPVHVTTEQHEALLFLVRRRTNEILFEQMHGRPIDRNELRVLEALKVELNQAGT
jgi:hypothetical protein